MDFNATFNNISVLLMEETSIWRIPPTCHRSLTNLSHNVVPNTPYHEQGLTHTM